MAGWINGAPDWSYGIYDYGLLYNEQTGWHQPLQCHITVCKPEARDGSNVHISMYQTQGAQISVYIPGNAWAKLYFRPDGDGELYDSGGPFNADIKAMPCYDLVKAQAATCFYEKYPGLRKQVLPSLADASAWPSL
jgi:hypothetical protein